MFGYQEQIRQLEGIQVQKYDSKKDECNNYKLLNTTR